MQAHLPFELGYAYLASPYTHESWAVREDRFEAAMKCTAWLLANKIWTYSPIVHCHDMAKKFNLPHDAAYWLEYDSAMVRAAEGILVLTIDGWEQSKGVTGEIEYAKSLGKSVGRIFPTEHGYERVWPYDAQGWR